ncbi:MAG: hypothetical protein HY770_00985 [Chitinivibrionia bacterium]|nr:hypothetical protein [Chitinivibrionia bacterium]
MELPQTLVDALLRFRAENLRLRLLERLFSAALVSLVIFMAFCLVERVVDIGRVGRTLAAAPIVLIVLGFAWRELRARARPATCQRVAEDAQRLFPEFGDRLLGAVELAYDEADLGEISPELRAAALKQVAAKAAAFDLMSRFDYRRWRRLALSFCLLLVPLTLYAVLFTQAFLNSLARLNNPWMRIDRFTFTRFADVPDELFMPRGEAAAASFALASGSRMPGRAILEIGDKALSAPLSDSGVASFEIPPLAAVVVAHLSAGDSSSLPVKLIPLDRPAIRSLEAELALPEYLKLPLQKKEVVAGVVRALIGGRAAITGTVTRPLASFKAETTRPEASVRSVFDKECFRTDAVPVAVGAPVELALTWTDFHGISSAGPFEVRIIPEADRPPEVSCFAKSRYMAILQNERLAIPALAKDDFGVKTLACAWQTTDDNGKGKTSSLSETELAPGAPDAAELAGEFVVDPSAQGIHPETIVTFNFLAKDYSPATDAAPSVTDSYQVHVLSYSQHVDAILAEMGKLSERLELIIQEEETNRQKNDALKLKAAEELDRKRLEELSKRHLELVKEALRNSRIPGENITQWLDAAGNLKEVAEGMFPKAVEEFQQAAEKPDDRARSLEKALETQDKILRALQKTQQKEAKNAEGLKFLNMAMRLKEAAEKEERLVKTQMTRLPEIAGKMAKELKPELRIEGEGLAAIQESLAEQVGDIKSDMESLLDRRKIKAYAQIVEEMKSSEIIPGLKKVGVYFRENVLNKGIRDASQWAKVLKEWAARLKPEDAGDKEGDGDNELSDADMEALIALGRILNQEFALRERTRDADKRLIASRGHEKAVVRHKEDAQRLSGAQKEIRGLLDGLFDAVGGKIKKPLKEAGAAMEDAKKSLDAIDTGTKAVGAETEAIDVISALFKDQSGSSRRMMAMLGALGLTPGGNPGGGGNLSGGSNAFSAGTTPHGETPPDKGVGGLDFNKVPAEYRDSVKSYFDKLPELTK